MLAASDYQISASLFAVRPLSLLRRGWQNTTAISRNLKSVTLRSFITLLMTLQLHLCPYLGCDECKAEAWTGAAAATWECDCGQRESKDNKQPLPANDCPDECCPCNCFCAGAVQPETVDCPELLVSDVADSWLDGAFSPMPLHLVAATSPFRLSSRSPAISLGRSVYTMTECWLL